MSFLINVIGTIVKQVAKRNAKNDAVKTADPVVFDEVQKKIETVDHRPSMERSNDDLFQDYLNKMREAEMENEASPNVETADKSVYNDLVQEIERLKMKVETQNQRGHIPRPEVPQTSTPQMIQAWNSTGTTLEARTSPNMGAPKSTLRIPDEGVFTVLDYSDNSIILDGQKARFVLVQSDGQQGWILENYLNFN